MVEYAKILNEQIIYVSIGKTHGVFSVKTYFTVTTNVD